MQAKGQGSIEFLSTYSMAFLVIGTVITILLIFVAIPSRTVPPNCSVYGVLRCVAISYTNRTNGGTMVQTEVTDTQPGILNISTFNVSVNGYNAIGSCSPSRLTQGKDAICTANITTANVVLNNIYTGVVKLAASYCPSGPGQFETASCSSTASTAQVYQTSGSFTAQGAPLTDALVVVPPSGDVLLYCNGAYTAFNAASNTNAARGTALLQAVSAATNGCSIYLKAETYDTQGTSIDQSLGTSGTSSNQQEFSIFGAGKYATVVDLDGGNLEIATNSVTADLSLTGTGSLPTWGTIASINGGTQSISNSIGRNLYIYGPKYGAMCVGTPSALCYIYNTTIVSVGRGLQMGTGSGSVVYIFDSNIVTIAGGNGISLEGNSSLLFGIANYGGKLYIVNTTVSVQDPNSLILAAGGTIKGLFNGYEGGSGGNTLVYGGNYIGLPIGDNSVEYSLSNEGAPCNPTYNCQLSINSTVIYNVTQGTITSIGNAGYGLYSYDRSPVSPPP